MNTLTPKHNLILLSVGKAIASGSMVYEATQFAWKTKQDRAEQSDYILAHAGGKIVGVFIADEWKPATDPIFGTRAATADENRIGFVGKEAPDDIQQLYLNKDLPEGFIKRGAANPVRFLEPTTTEQQNMSNSETTPENEAEKTTGNLVSLTFGMAIPAMVEDDDDLLLEPGDGIDEFKFSGTESLDGEALSKWVYEHIDLLFDGSLDEPEKFKAIRCVGIGKFGESDANYEEDQGLVLGDVEVFLEITPTDETLDEDELEDLFHLVVLRVKHEEIEMTYTEFEDYSAEVIDTIEGDYKALNIECADLG